MSFVVLQPVDQSAVTLLRRDVRVNQTHAQTKRFALSQIWLNEFGPFGADFFGNLGVTIAREISKDQVWFQGFGLVPQLNEVDGPCPSRSGTHVRDLCAQQSV